MTYDETDGQPDLDPKDLDLTVLETTAKLETAMANRASSVEPSPNSLNRIEARIATPVVERRDRYRFLAAAAVLLVIGGAGAVGLGLTSGDSDLATVSPASVPAVTVDLPDVASEEVIATTTELVPETTQAPDLQGFLAGPVAPTRAEAASLFVDLLGFEGATFEIVDNTALVYSPNESGAGVGPLASELQFSWVESREGYSVTLASSPEIEIDSPMPPE